jgi:hypothetical protein
VRDLLLIVLQHQRCDFVLRTGYSVDLWRLVIFVGFVRNLELAGQEGVVAILEAET